jgi:hypothetical protein
MQRQPNTPPPQEERREPLPVRCNTRPRANPELHRHDLERSEARMEMVIGR